MAVHFLHEAAVNKDQKIDGDVVVIGGGNVAIDAPYEAFKDISEYSENTTRSLDHLLKNVKMDCDVCSLRKICAEVENLLLLW